MVAQFPTGVSNVSPLQSDHSPPSSAEIKMGGAIPSFTQYVLMACTVAILLHVVFPHCHYTTATDLTSLVFEGGTLQLHYTPKVTLQLPTEPITYPSPSVGSAVVVCHTVWSLITPRFGKSERCSWFSQLNWLIFWTSIGKINFTICMFCVSYMIQTKGWYVIQFFFTLQRVKSIS
jgi:hypothetical protein